MLRVKRFERVDLPASTLQPQQPQKRLISRQELKYYNSWREMRRFYNYD